MAVEESEDGHMQPQQTLEKAQLFTPKMHLVQFLLSNTTSSSLNKKITRHTKKQEKKASEEIKQESEQDSYVTQKLEMSGNLE